MTLALGTWCAQLHHLSEPVRRDGQIKRTEIRFKRAPAVSDMTGNGIDQTPQISIASTQGLESEHTSRSWLQKLGAHRVDTAKTQQPTHKPTQMLVDETSDLDLDPGSTVLLITNSSSKSGSSALDAISIDSYEQIHDDFEDSELYCSTELERLSTVQPRATGQPHAEKQADQLTCSNNQTLISEQSWEVFDDGNTTQALTQDSITEDTSPARKRRRIAEPSHLYMTSQHPSNNRRVQPPQSGHGGLESSEHIDLSRAILRMIRHAHSIGHDGFLTRRNYNESRILIERFVGRSSVPMMLMDDDGPKNYQVVMEELRAVKRAIELLTGRW